MYYHECITTDVLSRMYYHQCITTTNVVPPMYYYDVLPPMYYYRCITSDVLPSLYYHHQCITTNVVPPMYLSNDKTVPSGLKGKGKSTPLA